MGLLTPLFASVLPILAILLGVAFVWGVFGLVARSRRRSSRRKYFATGEWRDEPPTDRQKEYADDLGIVYPPSITRGQLADLISRKTGQ
jgi:hypothetical protein